MVRPVRRAFARWAGVLGWLSAGIALAEPHISHVPPAALAKRTVIRAQITVEGGVFDARVYWRQPGERAYQQTALTAGSGAPDKFIGVLVLKGIPAIEYYIAAVGASDLAVGRWHSPETPWRLDRAVPVAAVEAASTNAIPIAIADPVPAEILPAPLAAGATQVPITPVQPPPQPVAVALAAPASPLQSQPLPAPAPTAPPEPVALRIPPATANRMEVDELAKKVETPQLPVQKLDPGAARLRTTGQTLVALGSMTFAAGIGTSAAAAIGYGTFSDSPAGNTPASDYTTINRINSETTASVVLIPVGLAIAAAGAIVWAVNP